MRWICVDYERKRRAAKRGAGQTSILLDDVWLVNAQETKNLPGRRSDIQESTSPRECMSVALVTGFLRTGGHRETGKFGTHA